MRAPDLAHIAEIAPRIEGPDGREHDHQDDGGDRALPGFGEHGAPGDADAAISSSDYSRNLSPFDPLLFAMLGSRAIALTRLGRFEEAASWAVKGAARPNAHAHIHAIAAFCLALSGSLDEARTYVAAIRRTRPRYGIAEFLDAFRFDADGVALFRKAARRVGMD